MKGKFSLFCLTVLYFTAVQLTATATDYETTAILQAAANLNVYEGQSHAQFDDDLDAPETKEAITEIANFFDRHLGK